MANLLTEVAFFPKSLRRFLSAINKSFFLNDSESIGIDDAYKPTCADNKHSNVHC